MIKRYELNPLIKPEDVLVENDEFEVYGVFNPGAAQYKDEIILLIRVALKPKSEDGWIKIPVADKSNSYKINILNWKKKKSLRVFDKDNRFIEINGRRFLTSISVFYLARSNDGIHFSLSNRPVFTPSVDYEIYGVEDPRIIRIDEKYYITYTAVSENGYCAALASTKDFERFERHGIIFPPENKDVVFFPGKIGSKYYALHRPNVAFIGKPSIWIAESDDLINWGNHKVFLKPRNNRWERIKIGAGPQPLNTEKGWLIFYHSCGDHEVYSMNLILTEKNSPHKITGYLEKPILIPRYKYEKEGIVPNVVFANGWITYGEKKIFIYYGASDKYVALAETTLDFLLGLIKPVQN